MAGQKSVSYGMGWLAGEMVDIPTISHSGDTMGFRSDVILTPVRTSASSSSPRVTEAWTFYLLTNLTGLAATALFL